MPAADFPLALLFAVVFLSSTPSFAELNVITSVGFEAAYNELVPVFQKSSGITVSTKHFASQGSGPDTIAAQLRAGAAADVVVLSKEGLGELLAEGRIIPATAVDLAQARLGVAVVPALASDLVRQRVAVIVAPGPPSALAAKAATATIPIVFNVGEDPVGLGLVASLARPGGNLTGINWFGTELTAKRLELLRELVPAAARVVLLVQPSNVNITELTVRNVETAARAVGVQIQVLNADTSREIDAAFATFDRERPDALFVGSSGFFNARRVQLAQLATYYRMPATYPSRQYVEAGGLMSYGSNILDAYREMGTYAGRILKGARPADLPVLQATKFELVINHQTARMLGLIVPSSLLATADEVIE